MYDTPYVYRLEPLHATDATNRKELLVRSRAMEQERSLLFRNLSQERHRRRTREWALRALKKRRLDIVQVFSPCMTLHAIPVGLKL